MHRNKNDKKENMYNSEYLFTCIFGDVFHSTENCGHAWNRLYKININFYQSCDNKAQTCF